MNEKQLEHLNTMDKMLKAWMPSCRTQVQIQFFEELLSLIEDIHKEDSEPCVLAIPISKDAILYNIADLFEYCDNNNRIPSQLTLEEKEMFIIEKE